MVSQNTASINTRLIDSLAQIVLALTDDERQLLVQKIQASSLPWEELQRKQAALKEDIVIGVEQLKNGEYVDYDDTSMPALLETIKLRGKQRLQLE